MSDFTAVFLKVGSDWQNHQPTISAMSAWPSHGNGFNDQTVPTKLIFFIKKHFVVLLKMQQ
jgi:hypothetical protein